MKLPKNGSVHNIPFIQPLQPSLIILPFTLLDLRHMSLDPQFLPIMNPKPHQSLPLKGNSESIINISPLLGNQMDPEIEILRVLTQQRRQTTSRRRCSSSRRRSIRRCRRGRRKSHPPYVRWIIMTTPLLSMGWASRMPKGPARPPAEPTDHQ